MAIDNIISQMTDGDPNIKPFMDQLGPYNPDKMFVINAFPLPLTISVNGFIDKLGENLFYSGLSGITDDVAKQFGFASADAVKNSYMALLGIAKALVSRINSGDTSEETQKTVKLLFDKPTADNTIEQLKWYLDHIGVDTSGFKVKQDYLDALAKVN
ncbi:hypothetical protein [Lacticaseibacillus saniviri]